MSKRALTVLALGGPTYFAGDVIGDGSASTPYMLNANSQDTLVVGVTGWF